MLNEDIPGVSISIYAFAYKAPQIFFIQPHNRPTVASEILQFNANNDLLTFLTIEGTLRGLKLGQARDWFLVRPYSRREV